MVVGMSASVDRSLAVTETEESQAAHHAREPAVLSSNRK